VTTVTLMAHDVGMAETEIRTSHSVVPRSLDIMPLPGWLVVRTVEWTVPTYRLITIAYTSLSRTASTGSLPFTIFLATLALFNVGHLWQTARGQGYIATYVAQGNRPAQLFEVLHVLIAMIGPGLLLPENTYITAVSEVPLAEYGSPDLILLGAWLLPEPGLRLGYPRALAKFCATVWAASTLLFFAAGLLNGVSDKLPLLEKAATSALWVPTPLILWAVIHNLATEFVRINTVRLEQTYAQLYDEFHAEVLSQLGVLESVVGNPNTTPEQAVRVVRELDSDLRELRMERVGSLRDALSEVIDLFVRRYRRVLDIPWPQGTRGIGLNADARSLLVHTLSNLLANAYQHAGSGTRVQFEVERHSGELHLIVSDDGPGFAGDPPSNSSLDRLHRRLTVAGWRMHRRRQTQGTSWELILPPTAWSDDGADPNSDY
jgi:hypothetical protein